MALRAGFHGTVGQPSAQVIDGSLKFDKGKTQYLSKTFSSAGNRNVWTWSSWVKRGAIDAQLAIFSAHTATNNAGYGMIWINQDSSDATFNFNNWDGGSSSAETSAVLRDTNGWYHLVVRHDENASPKAKLYINGQLQTLASNLSTSTGISRDIEHRIGHEVYNNRKPFDGAMSQCYFIDGQSLGPEEFGFTDPLTNTWRPKKYTGRFTSTRSESATLNTSFATTPPTDSTGTTTLTTQNISTQTASTNSFGVTTSTLFSGTSQYSRVLTNASVGSSAPFTIDFIAKFVQSGSSSYFCEFANGNAIIQTDNPAANTTCLLWGTQTFSMSYGWHSIRVQWDGSRSKLWVDGTLTLNITNAPGASNGNMTIGAHPTQDIRTFNGEFGPFRLTPAALGAPPSGGLVASDFTDSTSLSDGANSFYLPMDGNSPIGQDKSGQGNDWTPVNFGGSVALDNPIVSGALPILNTTQGGTQAGVGVRTDAYASNLFLAVPLVGNTNDVSNQINSGSTAKIATSSSVDASSTQSNFYGGSHHWNAASDTLQYAEQGNELVFGTGDYTIECWLYDDNGHNGGGSGRCYIFDNRIGGSVVGDPPTLVGHCDNHNEFTFYDGDSEITHSVPSTVGKWWHYAVTREGTTTRMFIDGIEVGSSTNSTNFTNNGIGVGRATDGGYGWAGYIQDFRVYKGVAKYTSDFVIPATSPDILPDTPSGVSGGSKLTKITDGAVSFDGSGDYLSLPHKASTYEWWDTPFTLEYYVYPNAFGASANSATNMVGKSDPNSNPESWSFGAKTNGTVEWYYWTGSIQRLTTTNTISLKKWTHLAFTHDGSNGMKIFIDGKVAASGTISGTPAALSTSLSFNIGKNANSAFNGMISNLRMVRGTALYTSNFTPSSEPLTNVTNTKLLCCQSNTQPGTAVTSPNMGGVNNGTNWSHFLTTNAGDNFDASGPKYYAFDGNGSNKAYTGNNSDGTTQGTSFLQVNFPSPISGALRVKCDNGNTVRNVTSGDTLLATQSSGSDNQFVDCGNVSNLSKLRVLMSGGSRPAISVVELDGTTLVDPASPVGNTAATNFNPFNTDINTVRGQETGYCTWNPLAVQLSGHGGFRDGNLEIIASTDGSGKSTLATFPIPSTGKWYWEVKAYRTGSTSNGGGAVGVAEASAVQSTAVGGGSGNRLGELNSSSWVFSLNLFDARHRNTADYSNYLNGGTAVADTGIIGIAVDMDNDKMWAHYNGVYGNAGGIGNPVTGANPAFSGEFSGLEIFPAGGIAVDSGSGYIKANWGQKPFRYTPPDGFQPLNAANVRPETVITRPDKFFNITEWSGNNADPRQINLGMAADMIWVKTRNQTNWHWVSDSLRGTADKRYKLYPNDPSAEDTAPIYGQADSINDTGFVAGGGTNNAGEHLSDSNKTGTNYICYSWKAGGSKFTYNKDGIGGSSASDIGVSATTLTLTGATINTRSKFGIYTYTGSGSGGATLNHGLGGTPGLVIYKKRTGSSSWQVYHQSLGGTKYMNLDENTDEYSSDSTRFGGTNSTSSTISLGTHANGATTVVLYAWCDVPGLQKFGSYTGNSNANGPFVELGFRPALLWLKRTDQVSTGNWVMLDTTRNSSNPVTTSFYADTNDQDYAPGQDWADILSNGFKIRATYGEVNVGSYIYCAWAEAPSFNLYGGQSNAR